MTRRFSQIGSWVGLAIAIAGVAVWAQDLRNCADATPMNHATAEAARQLRLALIVLPLAISSLIIGVAISRGAAVNGDRTRAKIAGALGAVALIGGLLLLFGWFAGSMSVV